MNNTERSRREVAAFVKDQPADYFCYVNVDKRIVTTWTGEKLGDVLRLGHKFRCGFWPGADRQSIKFRGINGRTYAGFYFCGSGDYCRVKACKA